MTGKLHATKRAGLLSRSQDVLNWVRAQLSSDGEWEVVELAPSSKATELNLDVVLYENEYSVAQLLFNLVKREHVTKILLCHSEESAEESRTPSLVVGETSSRSTCQSLNQAMELTRARRKNAGGATPERRRQLTHGQLPAVGRDLFTSDFQRRPLSGITRTLPAVREDNWAGPQLEEASLVQAVEQSPNPIVIANLNGLIHYVNPAFVKASEYEWSHVAEIQSLGFDFLDADRVLISEMMTELQTNRTWRKEIRKETRSKRRYWERISATVIRDEAGEDAHILVIGEDITSRKQAERTIHRMAWYDQLTSLPNRSWFTENLDRSVESHLKQNKLLALYFLDLDRFKHVNDTLGHRVGDLLLREAATRLQNALRGEGHVARLGGDEFTVIVENCAGSQHAARVGQLICDTMKDAFAVSGHELHAPASVGVAMMPEHATDSESLVQHADLAMYVAKSQGGNQYAFSDAAATTRSSRRFHAEHRIRDALRAGNFEMHFQPQVCARTQQLTGAEALIRMKGRANEKLSPQEFILIAEDCGLIEQIGEFVLRETARTIKTWFGDGPPPFRVAINLSARQISERLVDMVREILAEEGVRGDAIELELTETAIMRNPELAERVMEDLSSMGISITIDDFGVGYSSLQKLQSFRVGKLKIDRSFISRTPSDPKSSNIVQCIITLAHQMQIQVVAEGVEEMSQFDFLMQEGCDYIQGYLVGRPVDADTFWSQFQGANEADTDFA